MSAEERLSYLRIFENFRYRLENVKYFPSKSDDFSKGNCKRKPRRAKIFAPAAGQLKISIKTLILRLGAKFFRYVKK